MGSQHKLKVTGKPFPKTRVPKENQKLPVNKIRYWMPLLAMVLAFIIYSPAFKAGFVNWDDGDYVLDNLAIRSFDNIHQILTKPVQGNYHPFTMISLALNYAISGKDAGSYHVVNVLIHLINILLVFLFVRKLTDGKQWLAFIVSLFFAVHPLHVESVAWVSERKDVLYAMFFLWGLLFYLRYTEHRKTKDYLLTLGLFVLSLLSKPAAVVFPVVLLAIDYYQGKLRGGKIFIEKIPFLVFSIVMAILTLYGQKEQGAVSSAGLFPVHFRLFFGFYGIMMYIVKTVFPLNLCTFYPFPPVNQNLPILYYLAPLVSVVLLILFIYGHRKNKLLAFSTVFYLINLALVLQFLPVGSAIIADRYAYLPILGLFLIPAGYLQSWIDHEKGKVPVALMAIVAAVTLIFSLLAYRQVLTWQNSAALWDQAIKIAPSGRAYTNRGLIYKREQNYDKALEMYNLALKVNKAEKDALINRGNIYFNRQEYERAIEDYSECLKIDSLNFQALENRGAAFGALKKYDQALKDMKKSLELNPYSQNGYANRGVFYQSLGRHDEAIADFYKQMEVNREKSADLMNSIAVSYLNKNDYDNALKVINEALKLEEKGTYYLNRAICYFELGNKILARDDVSKAQKLGLKVDESFLKSVFSN